MRDPKRIEIDFDHEWGFALIMKQVNKHLINNAVHFVVGVFSVQYFIRSY